MDAKAVTSLTLGIVELMSSPTFHLGGPLKVSESDSGFNFEIAGFTLAIQYDEQPHLAPGSLVLRSNYSRIKEATFPIPNNGRINSRLKAEIQSFFLHHRKLVEPIEEFKKTQASYFK